MKNIEFNKTNLTEEEIEKEVKKVRAIVLNEKGQGLLVKYAGIYMLPGGKVEEREKPKESIAREILEETGIEIDSSEAVEFLRIKSYDRNYYDRVERRNLNRLTDTIFYEIHTKSQINEDKKSLTESEKEKNHQVQFINLSRIAYLVETNQTNNPKRKYFDRELLTALREFAEFKRQQENIKEIR